MNRSRSYTIAAVLLLLYSLIGVLFELPNLARGSVDAVDAPPFFLTFVLIPVFCSVVVTGL